MNKNSLAKTENYIFDLDGTLISTAGFILTALKMALDEMGISLEPSKMHKRIIGPPLAVMIKNLSDDFDDATVDEIVKRYRSIQMTLPAESYPNFEGVLPLLELLKSQNKKLFIATNRSSISTFHVLKQNKLHDFFDDIYTNDKHGEKKLSKSEMIQEIIEKHDLEKETTIMIGDTEADQKGAKTAGCTFIGVSWGYAADEHKFKQGSDLYITHINQILP